MARVLYGGDNESVGWIDSIDTLVSSFMAGGVESGEIADLIMGLLESGHHIGSHENGRYFASLEPICKE